MTAILLGTQKALPQTSICLSHLAWAIDDDYLRLALDLGPQFGSGFPGKRASFSRREGGLASSRIVKKGVMLF